MTLRNTIFEDQTAAMKARDEARLSTLRMLTAAIKNAEIEKKRELSDDEAQDVVARQAKQLSDAMKDFESGGREDLLTKTKAELGVLRAYLPKQLGDDELRAVVEEVVAQTGATSAADMGKVMGAVMGKVTGQADGNRVRALVEEALS